MPIRILMLAFTAAMLAITTASPADSQQRPSRQTPANQIQAPQTPESHLDVVATFPALQSPVCTLRSGSTQFSAPSANCNARRPYCPSRIDYRAGRGETRSCAASCELQTSAASAAAQCSCVINTGDCGG